MNKKAMSGWDEILKWMFILLIVIVIIVIIVGPEQLLAKTRDALFSFGIIKLPGDETPGFAGKSIPEEIKNYYYEIVSDIKSGINSKDSEKCKIEITSKKPGLKDYSVALYNGVIKLQTKAKEGVTPAYDPKTINGFTPCLYECKQTCSPSMKDVIINKDLGVASFLYKPDKTTVCVVAKDAEKSLNNMPKCS